MIQPVQRGAALLNNINNTQPASGEAAIWWLGQSGYAIKTASIFFYIDLYLSEHLTTKYTNTPNPHTRMTESPIRGGEITNAEWVFASHKHSDHLDSGTLPDLLAASSAAKLILPLAIVDHAISLGLARERLIPTRGDETFTVDMMTVHSIPSSHTELEYNEETGYPYLGFCIEVDGVRLYHSGDTIVYDGLQEKLAQFRPDIVFLPINGAAGRKQNPTISLNMNAQEAVDLAKAVGAGVVIPHHYDMFTFNTVDVGDFAKLAQNAGQPYQVLQCGERYLWRH